LTYCVTLENRAISPVSSQRIKIGLTGLRFIGGWGSDWQTGFNSGNGLIFPLPAIDMATIRFGDIASTLPMLCRLNGSVPKHSTLVSHEIKP
jgi:hypothetical protein